ncbi:hypothetical protein PV08_07312 [Exophiala spinifera]|uniref:Asl1-like glycosyl hydrolase catalytic domain-containing protein n=1 Tax=Exophiala spinifera TaxID=91928 RepID=A0A0D2B6P0_9EURO|nr:uncharacterized protein PV08_07312 [Exophiala spinifera]KIW14528.1 hypothetical protein PV08_07312 [Exophiala spinifera]
MVSQIFPLVVLATTVLAHPQRHHHGHFHGTGTGGAAAPTGGAFPLNNTIWTNSTGLNGSAIESPTAATAVLTVTVSPLPLESSTGNDSTAFSSVPVANAAATSPAAIAPVLSSSSSCTSILISTITSTTVELVTVTATPDASPVTDDSGKSVAAPSSSSAPLGDTELETGLDATSGSISFAAGTATAGAFFGRPSDGGWGSSYSAPEASAPAASSSSAVFSAAPTTFATIPSPAASSSAASGTYSSASSASSSTPSTGGGSSGGKKGLSYNTASLTDAFAGKGISWVYNWGASPDGTPLSGTEYVPMFWGSQSVSGWSSAVQSAISSGSKHVLSLNEPDLDTQANLDPETAAQLHIANVAPLSGQVSIGSPAITNGAGTSPLMGIDWLNQFFKACAGKCNIDFVAFHWYGEASNFADLQRHTQAVIDAASSNGVSKVWLTEFGTTTGSDSDVASFLSQAVEYLDGQSAVERYAFFMCSDGLLVNGNSISSPIGSAYAS